MTGFGARLFSTALLAAAALAGCAPSQGLRNTDRATIRTVVVAPAILLGPPTLITREMGFGAGIGGALGASIASLGATPEEQFSGYLRKNGIEVETLLTRAVTNELSRRATFQVVDTPVGADASIRLEITNYGLGYTANMFSHDYRAFIGVRATMTRADGKVVWTQRAIETAMAGDHDATPWAELFEKPDSMRREFTWAAQKAARELADDLAPAGR